MNEPASVLIIVVGITGDLAKRKVLPAIDALLAEGDLPENFRIIGITRQHGITADAVVKDLPGAQRLRAHLELFPMSLTEPAEYARLRAHIQDVDAALGGHPQHLWFLTVPPQTAQPIIEELGRAGLSRLPQTKLLLEKPFGTDGKSAAELAARIGHSFPPESMYRVDHYLAKEAVQNILVFRRENPLFERMWNSNFIDRIDIIVSEKIGIEGRGVFYEQAGALRDVVQNHLLQLAALTLMDLPDGDGPEHTIRTRHKLLQTLRVTQDGVREGQYEKYRIETGNEDSTVETFATVTLFSDDERWNDVPITLTTGKALAEKKTEIVITYRAVSGRANRLILQIDPYERIEFHVFVKHPDHGRLSDVVPLVFSYHDRPSVSLAAYKDVLLGALAGDRALFVSDEEVRESWRIVDAARAEWKRHGRPLVRYPHGATPEDVLAKDPL